MQQIIGFVTNTICLFILNDQNTNSHELNQLQVDITGMTSWRESVLWTVLLFFFFLVEIETCLLRQSGRRGKRKKTQAFHSGSVNVVFSVYSGIC